MLKIFPKHEETRHEEISALHREITNLQIKYERLERDYQAKVGRLEGEFFVTKTKKEKEIAEVDAVLAKERKEYDELASLLDRKVNDLNARANIVALKEEEVKKREAVLQEKEHEIQVKMEGIEDMADKQGEKEFEMRNRERNVGRREFIIKNREDEYVAKALDWNTKFNSEKEILAQKERELSLTIVSINAKEENLQQREELLKKEKILIESKRLALMAAQQQ